MVPKSGDRTCLAIVLAAGEGKRMQSSLPKVLHKVAGRSMVGHVMAELLASGVDSIAVVVGPGCDDVAAEAFSIAPDAKVFTQIERLGTAHAVLAAEPALTAGYDDVLIVFADTPLVQQQTFAGMRAGLAAGAKVVALGFETENPEGYGRLLTEGDELVAIREHKDASESERQVRICNAGLMALSGHDALTLLRAIGNDNVQMEYYLTDAVEGARQIGGRAVAVTADETEVMGVNDRVQLAAAEAVMQKRLRDKAMRGGATLLAPDTVYISWDTKFGRDVVVEPNVFFGPGVAVEDDAVIKASSHLEQAHVGPGASVGPFGRLRPGARLGEKAKVGNFVEIKAASIGASAAVSHLTYIGDATVGPKANIGAGTITCNYDGFGKHTTEIGAGAFIGSNSSLVAPVKIGDGAYVGSGSVITKDVEANALGVARGRQYQKPGWASEFRARLQNQRRK